MLASPEPAAKKQKMQLVDLLEGQKRLKTGLSGASCEETEDAVGGPARGTKEVENL